MATEASENRIRWLHNRIREGSYPNAKRLAERFGISHRQAQRDVEFLRAELGAPLTFDAKRRGYVYGEAFSLPATIRTDDPDDYVELLSSIPGLSSVAGENEDAAAMQIRIPYSAVLEIPSKLTALELGRFISGRAEGAGGDRYRCEFRNIALFLGVLLAADDEIRIIEPDWLREKLLSAAEKLLKCNSPVENAENDVPDT